MTAITLFRRYERVITYVLVGGCLALTYTAITTALILAQLVDDKTLASAIGAVVTTPLSYLAHARTTYRDVENRTSSGVRFAVVALCTLVIATGLMRLSVFLNWPFWIALAVSWALIPLANYTINALWVFRAETFWRITDRPDNRS